MSQPTQQSTTQPRRPSVQDLVHGGGDKAPALPLGPQVNEVPQRSEPGALLGGRIVDVDTFPVMETDYKTKLRSQKLYPSGDPIWGIVVVVDVAGLGERALFLDGSTKADRVARSKMKAALDALAAAGARDFEIGGELYLGWTHTASVGAGASPATHWAAEYRPAPRTNAAVTAVIAQATPVVAQVAPAVVPQIASPAVAVGATPPF